MVKRNPTQFLVDEYKKIQAEGREWVHRKLETPSVPEVVVDGKKLLMLCSNNYLNLSNHPHLKKRALEAVEQLGVGSGSVRAIAGNMAIHEEWEQKHAEFKEQEAAVVFMSGFIANEGAIPPLVRKDDFIISDELNHGSIIDGVRLTKTQKLIYKHCDMGELEKRLQEVDKADPNGEKRILVITDGVFSMDGDMAPLDEIQKLCEEYGAMIYVDDAHGDGVLGKDKKGKGIVDHFGLQGKVHVELNTYSKAMGVIGGAITGSKDLAMYLKNTARSYLLSGSHPPSVAGAAIGALEVLNPKSKHFEPVVAKLLDNCGYFKKEIVNIGFNHEITAAAAKCPTAIVPVICGENDVARKMSDRLMEEGIFALPIVFPMVPRGTARIRVMMNAGLSKEQLDMALGKFENIGRELKIF
ncbi:MAG: aminotransferase class I/II-fold pyridoxal phosphate-dependent enzyme [Candidatus Heimdallarchaeum endolithica]|uniref:Aminotransferase class I/II-fold pyridoxal phosphate-dependent enzyme n=1 Tax=Candidatus Heimdallarchaeum endolithica TaxID=2876572 RepID=A0A9Y1FPN9_9ARCH|nr:MAG: aminotransferase class I/II-fold pyridoxal phosphate-dependent enzyme [Candidatus Heimdallarchaeum endolithica]